MLQEEGFALTEALDPAFLDHAFKIHGCRFAEDPACIYTPGVVLWGLLSQATAFGHECSLSSTVIRIGKLYAQRDDRVIGAGTGAYANARKRFDHRVLQTINHRVADVAESAFAQASKGEHRSGDDGLIDRIQQVRGVGRIFMIDGFTVTMTDTAANQEAWPQNPRQKPGLGQPIIRCVCLISMTTGLVHDLAEGPYAGKQTGETALFRTLFHRLDPGDVLVADSYYCTWWLLEAAAACGITVVMKNHHLRATHPAGALRINDQERIADWLRPGRPKWMTREAYLKRAATIKVRLIDIEATGLNRSNGFTIATTALDPSAAPAWWIGLLFRGRWWVELDIRSIKDSMAMGRLRAKSPPMVRAELWSILLAYNLIRLRMMQAALSEAAAKAKEVAAKAPTAAGAALASPPARPRSPRTMSFMQALVCVDTGWLLHASTTPTRAVRLHAELVMLEGKVAHRPDREEPRAVKERRTPIALMTKERWEYKRRSKVAA